MMVDKGLYSWDITFEKLKWKVGNKKLTSIKCELRKAKDEVEVI